MPQERHGRQEARPQPPSFEERREALFAREIKKDAERGRGPRDVQFIARVFEHSIEDGLRLAERLRLTPREYNHAIFSVSFAIKHPKVFDALWLEDKHLKHLTETEAVFGRNVQSVESLFKYGFSFDRLNENGRELWAVEQYETRFKDATKELDALYVEVLHARDRKLKLEPKTVEGRTEGEVLADRYLRRAEEALEGRFYTGPVKDMFPALAGEKAFFQPTIKEVVLKEILRKKKLQADAALSRLESARVVMYEPIHSVQRRVAEQQLIKDIVDELPEGQTVELDAATGTYRVAESEAKKSAEMTYEEMYNNAERLRDFDERVVVEMRKLLEQGADVGQVAEGLAGMDSLNAWDLRRELLQEGADPGAVAVGLAGLESSEAWKMRRELLQKDSHHDSLAFGLAGVDSPEAWKMRRELLAKGANIDSFAQSLTGLDSPEAWKMRRELLQKGVYPGTIVRTLAGVDSPEAWKMRREMIEKDVDPYYVVQSLDGLDSLEAWKMRREMIEKNVGANRLVQSLVGLDSPEAWKMRRAPQENVDPEVLAESLAGVDSPEAWEMRRYLLAKAAYPGDYAKSFSGDHLTFVWRLRKEPFGKHPDQSPPGFDLLNLVHNPTLAGIRRFREQHPPLPRELSEQDADVLARAMVSDREAAQELLSGSSAVPDRAPARLAEELLRRLLPERAKAAPSFWNRLTSGFGASSERPSASMAFAEQSSLDLVGAGAEDLKDKRTLIEARDAMDALLVTGIYGRYDSQRRSWQKTYFPARREPPDPARETTLTLKDVAGAGRVSLPLPLDARLVQERVKGITHDKREIALAVTSNALGEATVEVPKDVVSMLYSIEQPIIPEPLPDPSAREMESHRRAFEREYGRQMTEPLAILPHEVEAEVTSKAFKALTPKRQVMRIEELVRGLGWYDTDNQEIRDQKAGKTPEEQIVICEERLDMLRSRNKDPSMAGKKFAGVCTDFALITAALLRKAGYPAGILGAIHLAGKSAAMHDLHATAFVPWPDGRGGIRIIPVDGTPSSSSEQAADIARPTLAEQDAQAAEKMASEVQVAETIIADIVQAAHANDVATIRKLTNSKLEQALNVILHHEVKTPHLRVVERLLDAYWYGGLQRADRIEEDIVLRRAFEQEIISERRKVTAEENAVPAGTRLLETVREFVRKFQRGGAVRTFKEAFDLLDRIANLAQGELSDVERRALAVTITYLRAEKMR